MKPIAAILCCLTLLVACSKEHDVKVTIPVAQRPSVRANLGDKNQSYEVFGSERLHQAIESRELKSPNQEQIRQDSLTVAFPKKLLGENFVFGGVITKVSDSKSDSLGNFKLSDLPPVFVKPELSVRDNNFQVDIKGCLEKCTEGSQEEVLVSIPVVALDTVNDRVVLDLAALGEKLNLIKTLDPNGEETHLKTVKSQVSSVDFSVSTLVFDVEVTMEPIDAKEPAQLAQTKFTVRWYLRLGSIFNPSFVPRDQTEGVGYFLTERGINPKIIRHSLSSETQGSVKYYLKNIPEEYKESFKKAFEGWNEKFVEVTGKPIFKIEFIDAEDPRSQALVPGDVRYNILEWDLDNQASYGGLGPSIANPYSGEILSSNVLIQGPRVVQIYKGWFKVAEKVKSLREQGQLGEAESLLRNFALSTPYKNPRFFQSRMSLSLGARAGFKIHAQEPPTQDPVFQKDDFDIVPEGVSYEKYMSGYFFDMVAHELGHNLGLRHNFSGNLGATEGVPTLGKVSSSVMEYLGRGFRYLDQIGNYDVMALKYGYLGIAPEVKNMYCTDEHVPDSDSGTLSAECSRDDATTDPVGFFVGRIKRSVDLVIARATNEAPVWKAEEMIKTSSSAIQGLAFYASSAESTGSSWKQFFNKPGRPQNVAEVPQFVLELMSQTLCPADLDRVLSQKSPEARLETQVNLLSYIKWVNEKLKPLNLSKNVGEGCL